ncbi:hypothetical protein JHK84_040674 [Glycine max]|nr:hypothetical protein JHK84_040674 [Glycine max]
MDIQWLRRTLRNRLLHSKLSQHSIGLVSLNMKTNEWYHRHHATLPTKQIEGNSDITVAV